MSHNLPCSFCNQTPCTCGPWGQMREGFRKDKFKENFAAVHPKLSRGQVWCLKCGRTEKVDSGACLRSGWPECCGETMTLDSPEERR